MSYLSGVDGHGETLPLLSSWPSQSLTGKSFVLPISSWSVLQFDVEWPVSLQT